MVNALLTSAALMCTTALAGGLGKAIVVNNCNYDVSLSNVPASGGGYSSVDQKLSPGGTYSQTWTSLSNTMGWSLKLFKGSDMSNLLQYEYTCHDDGIIWYDLSEVNGNPWDSEGWMIEGSPGCSPRQAAYRHPTDDAYGMQDCPDDSTITVTVCADSSDSSSGSPSSPAESYAPSSPAPSSTSSSDHWDLDTNNKVIENVGSTVEDKKNAPAPPSTLTTSSVDDSYRDPNAVYVTNVHTVHVTHTVTADGQRSRHTHHPRHAHNRR